LEVCLVVRQIFVQSRHNPLNVPYPNGWQDFNEWWTPGSCAPLFFERGCGKGVARMARYTRGQVGKKGVIFSDGGYPCACR
jgi:hypothetical protein